jgi:PAS domain S-box-containing protein
VLYSRYRSKQAVNLPAAPLENSEGREATPPTSIIANNGEPQKNGAHPVNSHKHDNPSSAINVVHILDSNAVYAPHEQAAIADDNLLAQRLLTLLEECQPLLAPAAAAPEGKNPCDGEKYEYMVQYGTQVLCLFTPSGGCTYLSCNFEKLTGHSNELQMGEAFFSLIHNDYRARLREVLCAFPSPAASDKAQMLRLKMQHQDGKYYWYQFTIHPEKQEYVCLMENIQENMQTQNILQKAKLEAELALRARSEFLANMNHELRTPLNAVIGFSQIMEKGIFGEISNPHYIEYIQNIQQSGYDLLAKIEDLLEISNIDAGRVALECGEIYIDDLIKQVMQAQSHHAESAKVSLSYIPRGNILLFVDRLKLQHIMGHLINNAIKFNRAGGEVTIEVNRSGTSGVCIAIHDNGTGMNDLKCHDIRESLQQDKCWTAKNSQHIGIGLALAKEFIALHGGTVEITSSAGIGTTVSIILPRECIRLMPERKTKYIRKLENG